MTLSSYANTGTLSTSLTRRQKLVPALAALATLLAVLAVAAPAGAAASCGRQVIDDWYDDGRVDGTYALHCYDDAIEALPRDVRDYSSAKEDIERALQARLRGKPAPAATEDPSPTAEDPKDPDTSVPSEDPDDPTSTASQGDPDAGGAEAASATDGESASSVPLPLLVLAGLALLLVAGGTAGYLYRRYRGGDAPPPAV
jgi:hypothetical protein